MKNAQQGLLHTDMGVSDLHKVSLVILGLISSLSFLPLPTKSGVDV